MIRFPDQQPKLWAGFLAEEVEEPWMPVADRIPADEALIQSMYKAQAVRHLESRTLGRPQVLAESRCVCCC
jgi:hypothetical protein